MKKLLLILLIFTTLKAVSQDDLLALVQEESNEATFTEATFKGTRLINGHSIETRKKGVLDFIISHRFGTLNSGSYELWGLDNATIRLGLEYAVTDRLYLGLGRSSFEKTYDGFAKYRLLRQLDGAGMPVSVTWFSSIALKTIRNQPGDPSFEQKLASTHQLLIARKMSPGISLQLMPTLVHKNLILEQETNNQAIAMGVGGRVKVSPRVALVAEYYYQFQKIGDASVNPIAVGFDIETGGHVFQLQFTNATAMVPKGFIAETTNDFFDGGIHFGFNISRTFQLN